MHDGSSWVTRFKTVRKYKKNELKIGQIGVSHLRRVY